MEVRCSGCHQLKYQIFGVSNRFCPKIAKFLILNYGQAPIKIGLIQKWFDPSLAMSARVRTNSSNYSFFRIVRYRIVYSIRYSFSFQLTNTIRSFEKSANEYQIHILPIFKTVLVQNCPKIFDLNKYCAEICMFQLMLAIKAKICPFNTLIFIFSLELHPDLHFCRKNNL